MIPRSYYMHVVSVKHLVLTVFIADQSDIRIKRINMIYYASTICGDCKQVVLTGFIGDHIEVGIKKNEHDVIKVLHAVNVKQRELTYFFISDHREVGILNINMIPYKLYMW